MRAQKSHLRWLEPITLEPANVKSLRRAFREKLREQGAWERERCVYVIRMVGLFVVQYPYNRSPVLYIGRGTVSQRVIRHLTNWVSQVTNLGAKIQIEIRVSVPRKRNHPNFYKCVEADLIRDFSRRYGSIPLINSRRETVFESDWKYTPADKKRLTASLGVGRGNRPRWAIAPAPGNRRLYDLYHRGVSEA